MERRGREGAGGPYVYLHSSRRSPGLAWPIANRLSNSRFAIMPGYGAEAARRFDQDAWESRLLGECDGGGIVVAHSFGGPVAMSAAFGRADLVRALVLFEPAAYALGRGLASVEGHISRLQPVLDRAEDLDAAHFAVEFAAAMSGEAVETPTTPGALLDAERQRLLPGPWTLDTPATTGVPTLVITGGWNDQYESIADRIADAEHVVLTGHGHRPQDHPDAADVLLEFVNRSAAP
ncbi:alpha/beta fold hydrolase [Rathayibacter sp. CAU 1779]